MRLIRPALAVLALVATPHVAFGQGDEFSGLLRNLLGDEGHDAARLPLDTETRGALNAHDPGSPAAFVVEVPESAVALVVDLVSPHADLDLQVQYADDPAADDVPSGWSDSELGVESVRIDRYDPVPLRAGKYRVEVRQAWTETGFSGAASRLDALPFTITASTQPLTVSGTLELDGAVLEGAFDEESGRARQYRLDVPPDTESVRIDVLDCNADVDLYVSHGGAILEILEADHIRDSAHACESLVIGVGGEGRAKSGAWHVLLIGFDDPTLRTTRFRLRASSDPEPPAQPLPEIPSRIGAGPLAHALPAMVELYLETGSGSATLVSPRGHLLTAAHVVSNLAMQPAEGAVVAVTLDARSAPRELFRASVLWFDRDADLALLQIDRTVHGAALPEAYRFPYLPLGNANELSHGDPLWILGFPRTGGSSDRNPVTASRGVVCGWERLVATDKIKTDAELTNGSSGGAALTGDGQLIGVPVDIQEWGSSHLGYLVPVSTLPPIWHTTLAVTAAEER